MNVLALPYEDPAPGSGQVAQSDIQPRHHVTLLVNAVQVGLDGDDTWSLTARARQVSHPLAPRTFSFTLSPSNLDEAHARDPGGAD
ncbi:hypothetical protein ASD79_10225 [Caulobacter sp. Root655]|nr:hypothetical protein ASD79_10225 [Caulobacter sp. Root655]